ncbi:uncharacterized protein LOC143462494 [Clavelina lepadiformis]|uniref:uncharacterized protein LOC143462494 n=1 Tax=Clavelina lepadiformis TaxID=159417 RepID=UPI0040420AE4
MENTKVEKALSSVKDFVFCNNSTESQDAYTRHSVNYDKELDTLNYQSPQYAAKMFGKYCDGVKAVLDIGTGTGKAAELIRKKYGYEGDLDLLDANLGMLVQADKKGFNIRNVIRHWVDEKGELPLKDESYDIVLCVGSFVPHHIPVTALWGMIKSVKRGGLFIVTTRSTSTESYKMDFDRTLQKVIDAKELELVEKEDYKNFPNAQDELLNVVIVLRRV